MGTEQIIIGQRFNTGFTKGGVSKHMGIQIPVRIRPGLSSIFIHQCFGKQSSVLCKDLSSNDPFLETVQSCAVLRIIDDLFTFHLNKIAKIQAHAEKQTCDRIHKKPNVSVSLWIWFCLLHSPPPLPVSGYEVPVQC